MSEELFPVVDETGKVVGKATRKECHSGSMILHPVVHLHVLDADKRLFLQHRSMKKDVQPGKWDTSVGGHVDYGKTIEAALLREAREELGLTGIEVKKLFTYKFTSSIECELVNAFYTVCRLEDITVDGDEITEGRFFSVDEILDRIGTGFFTPNFEQEFFRLREFGLWDKQ